MEIKLDRFGTNLDDRSAQADLIAVLKKSAPPGVAVLEAAPPSEPHPDWKWYDNIESSYPMIEWDRPVDVDALVAFLGPHVKNRKVYFETPEDSGQFRCLETFSREALLQLRETLERGAQPQADLDLPGAPGFTAYLRSRAAGKWTMQGPKRTMGADGQGWGREWLVKLDGVRIGAYEISADLVDGKCSDCSYVGSIPGLVETGAAQPPAEHPENKRPAEGVWLQYTKRYYEYGVLHLRERPERADRWDRDPRYGGIPFP